MTQLATLVERLRGIVRVPVNDGAGLLDGKDFFERSSPTSNLACEAATEIERLNAVLSEVVARANQPSAGEIELLTKISDMHRIARYAQLSAPAISVKDEQGGAK